METHTEYNEHKYDRNLLESTVFLFYTNTLPTTLPIDNAIRRGPLSSIAPLRVLMTDQVEKWSREFALTEEGRIIRRMTNI